MSEIAPPFPSGPEHPTEGPEMRAHPERHVSAPRRRRGRRKAWSAGHALITVVVALGLGTLLNADALLNTAEGLQLDTVKRDIAVGIMEPVDTVAGALRLTAPRSAVDSALGKEDIGAEEGEDPFAEFAADGETSTGPTASSTPATGGGAGEPTTTTVPEPIGEDNPLLLWVAGDSLSFEYGKAVIRAASDEDLIDAVPEVSFQVATGLSRPDVYNWPQALADGMTAYEPDVVVFMAGSNDDQSVTDPDGNVHACCDAAWQREYSRRVGAVMDQVVESGRTMVYVNVPIMGGETGSRNPNYQVINDLIATEAESRPDVIVVDAYRLFQNRNGNYSQYLGGDKVRADDNVHFERPGGDRLTDATFSALRAAFGLPADDEESTPTTASQSSPATTTAPAEAVAPTEPLTETTTGASG